MGKENSLGKRKINCKTIIIAIQRASFESNLRLSFIKFWRKSLEKCRCKRIYSATSITRIRQTKTLSNVKKSWHNLWGIRAAELAKDWWISFLKWWKNINKKMNKKHSNWISLWLDRICLSWHSKMNRDILGPLRRKRPWLGKRKS